MNIHLTFTVAWGSHVVAGATAVIRVYSLSFRMSFYYLTLAGGGVCLNSVVSLSTAAPVTKQTGCRLEGDTA